MVLTRNHKNSRLSSALVAVVADESDEDAVKLARESVSPQKGSLYIVHVIEVDRSLPVDAEIAPAAAKGEEVLKRMETIAQAYRSDPEAELLQSRRAGPAIVQEAVDKRVDAIILGIPYAEEYGNFSLGETARYVLKNEPCRVILWREPMPRTLANNGVRPRPRRG